MRERIRRSSQRVFRADLALKLPNVQLFSKQVVGKVMKSWSMIEG